MKQQTYFLSQKALNSATPKWATTAFRVSLILTTAISGYIAATGLISIDSKLEIVLGLKWIDFIVWGIGKLIGVVPSDEKIDKL